MKLQTKDFKFVAKLDQYDYHHDANGVIRWNSNNSVPPRDILELAWIDGKISEQTLTISLATKSEEDDAFLKQYILMRQKNGYSEEELCDINANFDSSETVVDVITGQIIRGAV
jgi:hypothetical protein